MAEYESITSEAKQLLERQSNRLARELEQEAVRVARVSRGTPVEITVSDVKRAGSMFGRRESRLAMDSSAGSSSFAVLVRLYLMLGIAMVIVGALYPILLDLLEQSSPEIRVSIMITMADLL